MSAHKTVLCSTCLFVVLLAYFVAGLAPSVTLQDSGELALAVHTTGIPHPPGYPLFVLLGKLFSLIPMGDLAYRLNFMSAFFSALGGVFYFLAGITLLSKKQKLRSVNTAIMLLTCAIGVIVPHSYRQAVITEVYGLNTFLFASSVWLIVQWHKSPHKSHLFLLAIFVSALSLTNHHTSLMLFPAIFLVWLATENRRSVKLKHYILIPLLLVMGLLPYIYHPLASLSNPFLDWGDPENWDAFVRVISRAQYAPHLERPPFLLLEQLRQQVLFLIDQIPLYLLFLGFFGLGTLLLVDTTLFVFFVGLLTLTGPVTAALTNFHLPLTSLVISDVLYLWSVFFIPHYGVWGIIIGYGVVSAVSFSPHSHRKLTAAIATVLLSICALWIAFNSHQEESKRGYQLAKQNFENWQSIAKNQPALILSNWDIFYFSTMYFQFVHHQGGKSIYIDIEMLKAPWYIASLDRWYSEIWQGLEKEKADYYKAARRIEKGIPYSRQETLSLYGRMLNKLIQTHLEKMPVYVTISRSYKKLPAGIAANHWFEPQIVASRIKERSEVGLDAIRIDDFNFEEFSKDNFENEHYSSIFREYHCRLILDRTILLQKKNLDFEANELTQRFFPLCKRYSDFSKKPPHP
jgi:hypothetical protein